MRDLCTKMSWELHEDDPFWTIRIDTGRPSQEIPEQNQQNDCPKTAPSEVRNQKPEVRNQKPEESAGHVASPSAPEPDQPSEEAPTIEQAKAAKAKLERDVNKALNILLDQPGGLEEKRLWLTAHLRGCEAWCKDNGKQFRSGLLSWWRNYAAKPERPYREQAEKEKRRLQILAEARARGLDPYETPFTPEAPPEMLAAFMANNVVRIGRAS